MIYKINVKGRVQGVFYRKSVSEVANAFGLKGYVKNLNDGSVEIIVSIPSKDLPIFLEAIHFRGDPLIRVLNIDIKKVKKEEVNYDFKDFRILY